MHQRLRQQNSPIEWWYHHRAVSKFESLTLIPAHIVLSTAKSLSCLIMNSSNRRNLTLPATTSFLLVGLYAFMIVILSGFKKI